MESRSIYESIATRTNGDIYIGVVGPVRTGKSTFIKNFMEIMVIPNIDNIYVKERARDELPQSGSGKTIMTAEPKFVPEEAVRIMLDGTASCQVRLIDCVGYMVNGAMGQYEGNAPRMVTTPWMEEAIPLAQAAEMGTRKVITEHSTIGLVVTTDGSIGELRREDYVVAEERIVAELKEIDKPFGILLNCADPCSEYAQELRGTMEEKYGVSCVAVNCMNMSKQDIEDILTTVLYEFPAREFSIDLPDWVSGLPDSSPLRGELYDQILNTCGGVKKMHDARPAVAFLSGQGVIEYAQVREMDLGVGIIFIDIGIPRALFYQILSEQSGIVVESEGQLLPLMCEMAAVKRDYERIRGALMQVQQTGYGIVMPTAGELKFEKPEIVKQGGKFGVRLRASAPSIHLIRADIETEISPIVGSEKQSEDLVKYLLAEFEDSPEKIWQSDIFGKSLSELVNEGLNNKLYKMPEEARSKIQETLQRIINEGSGGLICIIF